MTVSKTLGLAMEPGSLTQPSGPPPPQIDLFPRVGISVLLIYYKLIHRPVLHHHASLSCLAGLRLCVIPAPAMFSSFSNISIRKLVFSTLSVNECKYLQNSLPQV